MWLVVFALFGVAAVAPFLAEQRKPDMDERVRGMVPGSFTLLSDGHTHYQWHGPAGGPVLVCVHGLTTPSYVFDALLPGLTQAGFRVLTYDLYGRGRSDRPAGAQTRSFFIRQLRELLQDQGVGGQISILGYSMGGSIATVFAAEEPERVSQLILLAPAGMVYRPSALAKAIQRAGPFGTWAMLAFGGGELRRAAGDGELGKRQIKEIGWRGYLPAVLSSQRHMLSESLGEEHAAIQSAGTRVCAIWGELDRVIPLSAMGKLAEWNRTAQQTVIPGAGHALAVTHATEVLEALADLLND